MDITSVSLLDRLREPADSAAWQRFVELYTPLLYYWARGAGLQEQDAADLVQDVLTLLVQKMPAFEYDREKSFRGWLRTVTLNKWREQRRRREVACLGSVDEAAEPDGMEAFEEAEYKRQIVGRGLSMIEAEFSHTTWNAFQRHVVQGQGVAQVSAELGISRGTVYAAKSRVLTRLRQEVAGLMD